MIMLQAGSSGKWQSITAEVVGNGIQFVVDTADKNFAWVQFAWAIAVCALALFVMFKAVKMVARAFTGTVSFFRNIREWWLSRTTRIRKSETFRRMKGRFMARSQASALGSRINFVIGQMEKEGLLQKHVSARARKAISEALKDPTFFPKTVSVNAIRHHFVGSKKNGKDVAPTYQKLAGPVKPIPGKPADPPALPVDSNVSSAFLSRIRDKNAA